MSKNIYEKYLKVLKKVYVYVVLCFLIHCLSTHKPAFDHPLCPRAPLCLFATSLKRNNFCEIPIEEGIPTWNLAGAPSHPGHSVAIGWGSDQPSTRVGLRGA